MTTEHSTLLREMAYSTRSLRKPPVGHRLLHHVTLEELGGYVQERGQEASLKSKLFEFSVVKVRPIPPTPLCHRGPAAIVHHPVYVLIHD